MIYSTFETKTDAFLWNTGLCCELEKNTHLSDYTEIEQEIDEKTLKETFERVASINKGLSMETPKLMLVTTGFYKSVRVWVDQSLLDARPEIEDPLKGFEYYSED